MILAGSLRSRFRCNLSWTLNIVEQLAANQRLISFGEFRKFPFQWEQKLPIPKDVNRTQCLKVTETLPIHQECSHHKKTGLPMQYCNNTQNQWEKLRVKYDFAAKIYVFVSKISRLIFNDFRTLTIWRIKLIISHIIVSEFASILHKFVAIKLWFRV